jgi:hypothetical protein
MRLSIAGGAAPPALRSVSVSTIRAVSDYTPINVTHSMVWATLMLLVASSMVRVGMARPIGSPSNLLDAL